MGRIGWGIHLPAKHLQVLANQRVGIVPAGRDPVAEEALDRVLRERIVAIENGVGVDGRDTVADGEDQKDSRHHEQATQSSRHRWGTHNCNRTPNSPQR